MKRTMQILPFLAAAVAGCGNHEPRFDWEKLMERHLRHVALVQEAYQDANGHYASRRDLTGFDPATFEQPSFETGIEVSADGAAYVAFVQLRGASLMCAVIGGSQSSTGDLQARTAGMREHNGLACSGTADGAPALPKASGAFGHRPDPVDSLLD